MAKRPYKGLETHSRRIFRRPMLSEDQASIVSILMANNSTMWQVDLVKKLDSQIQRQAGWVNENEADGHIRRIRDGMGKRIELTEDIK